MHALRPSPAAGVRALIVGTLVASASGVGHAAEAITDYLTKAWYVTEVIVLQRIPVMEVNSVERLIVLSPPPLANGIRTFFPDPDQVGAGYQLDGPTREMLAADLYQPTETLAETSATEPLVEPSPEQSAIAPIPEPDPLAEFIAAIGNYEAQLEEQSYRWLPASRFLMARDATIIKRHGMQVLLHGRWLQPVPDRDQPEPMFVQAGSRFAERYQLEGTLAVTLGRYLHFQAQLTYREPGLGARPIGLPVSLVDPPRNVSLPGPMPGVMVLNQSRRMRSEEVHYLDHPKLGVLVRIDPVGLPDDLVADFEALQEPIE